ncbi:hypothetical protein GCK72_016669 [Caenorhabditis remanei]|uniref:Uncharacterized protein n=1 Tax=Caenorhabditis remanei TaxID=31234 RepID=A0A2P4VZK3_CAERE|nr:hypothetical protein GCK72_016669 [Caenorhabditis remanei]KAF1750123.1 hypothetical protein GCK72_016669 [Caenorhabditis remanei]
MFNFTIPRVKLHEQRMDIRARIQEFKRRVNERAARHHEWWLNLYDRWRPYERVEYCKLTVEEENNACDTESI